MNHLSGLATLGILFAAQNFHHSLLFVHPPEELLARKVRSLFYGRVLLPLCRLSGKWLAPRTAERRSATLASTTWQAVVTSSLSSNEAMMVVGHILRGHKEGCQLALSLLSGHFPVIRLFHIPQQILASQFLALCLRLCYLSSSFSDCCLGVHL